MAENHTPRGGLMPHYNTFSEHGIEVSGRPCGLRRVWPIRRWPFFTGDRLRIHLTIKALEPCTLRDVNVELRSPGPRYSSGEHGITWAVDRELKTSEVYQKDIPSDFLVDSGQRWVRVRIHIARGEEQPRIDGNVATFEVRSGDSLALLGFAIFASLVITVLVAIGSVFGGWWMNRTFTDNSPRPVYIVDPTPSSTTTPESHEN